MKGKHPVLTIHLDLEGAYYNRNVQKFVVEVPQGYVFIPITSLETILKLSKITEQELINLNMVTEAEYKLNKYIVNLNGIIDSYKEVIEVLKSLEPTFNDLMKMKPDVLFNLVHYGIGNLDIVSCLGTIVVRNGVAIAMQPAVYQQPTFVPATEPDQPVV